MHSLRRAFRLHSLRSAGLRHPSIVAPAALLAMVFAPAAAGAAELQLRSECRAQGAVVRLGDVAEVVAADAQQAAALGAIELFPAPAPGRQRFVRLREIQDLLLLRGINLAEHRFSGAAQVSVLSPAEPARPAEPRLLPFPETKRSERLVSDAVRQYLRERVSGSEGWNVDVPLDAAAARAVSEAPAKLAIRGGAPPWMGNQRFDLTVDTPQGPRTFPVDARVWALGSVVVAARSLARGIVLRAEDCQLRAATPGQDRSDCFQAVGEVVGQETTRAVAEGKALDRESLRPPLVVRRSEIITVYARGPGVSVRTTARAREDGSLGELVAVESLSDRKVYTARVCGIQEVEVMARATQAAGAANGAAERVARQIPVRAEIGSAR